LWLTANPSKNFDPKRLKKKLKFEPKIRPNFEPLDTSLPNLAPSKLKFAKNWKSKNGFF
jgi:hypothetical protein